MISRLRNHFTVTRNEETLRTVKLVDCVHYCGFKYGGTQYNPYQTFIYQLHKGQKSRTEISQTFVDFLRSYQPRHFGEALSVKLSRQYPLWHYPWNHYEPSDFYEKNWLEDPDDIVDILTQKCEKGILSFKIEREFYWLQRALDKMKTGGYMPEQYSWIEVASFERINGKTIYLVLDGNHRLSALHALGYQEITVKIRPNSIIREIEIPNWPCVKNELYTEDDARILFNAYFEGNADYFKASQKASIIRVCENYSIYET